MFSPQRGACLLDIDSLSPQLPSLAASDVGSGGGGPLGGPYLSPQMVEKGELHAAAGTADWLAQAFDAQLQGPSRSREPAPPPWEHSVRTPTSVALPPSQPAWGSPADAAPTARTTSGEGHGVQGDTPRMLWCAGRWCLLLWAWQQAALLAGSAH